MKKFIIVFCAAMLALLSACALADTSVTVMGRTIEDGDAWRFMPISVEIPGGKVNIISAEKVTDGSWNAKYESGVLTLKDIYLTGYKIDYDGPAIVADGDLALRVEGLNSLPAGGNYGMYVGGNLEVSGDEVPGEDRLYIVMECAPDSAKDLGIIVVSGNLTVNSGELIAQYDRNAVTGVWNSAAGVDVGGNIMVTGGYLWSNAPAGKNGVVGIRAQSDITVLGGEMYGYSYTCYMDENGDRKGGDTGVGVWSEGGSIILDGGELLGADGIQFGSTDFTGVRREGAKGAGIYARKNIVIKSGSLWANALECEEGYALICREGKISILDESLDIGAHEYEVKIPWNGRISPDKRTIHTAKGKIARYVMIRDAVSEVPETGDEANLVLWFALAAISAIGMTALRRKKEA